MKEIIPPERIWNPVNGTAPLATNEKTIVALERTWSGVGNTPRSSEKEITAPERTWSGVGNTPRSSEKEITAQDRTWGGVGNTPPIRDKAITAQDRTWGNIGTLPLQLIREFKGVNTLDRFAIDPSFATDMKNITSTGFPALHVRPGFAQVGTTMSRILGLGTWKDQELHAVANNGNWYKWTGTAWSSLYTGLSASANFSFCNFEGNLGAINLIGVNGAVALKYSGSTVTALSGVPAGSQFIDQHDNRLYAAVGNSLHCSALSSATDWTTVDDAGEFSVETNNGEQINGIKAGNGHVMIFKPSSVHELWGTDPINFSMQSVARDIGALSHQCITNVRSLPYWMDQNAIYMYGGSRPRSDFSLPVNSIVKNINASHKSKACAGTDGSRLYVSLPYDTATEPNVTLEYDPDFNTWFIWKDFTPLHYTFMAGNWYAGDSTGRVLQMAGSTSDNGTAIAWEWVSKPFGGGSLAERLQWYRMWYVADVPSGSTLNIFLSRSAEGDSDWTLVKTVTAGDLQAGRAIIPVDTVANANWVRVKFSGTGPMQLSEFDYQMRELPMF